MSNENENKQSNLDIAIEYANRGWAVLPLFKIVDGKCSCGNELCKSPGKHPSIGKGVKDASIDVNEISKLSQTGATWDEMNIGIATGELSNIFVVDIDPRHKGDISLAKLEQEHEILITLEALTGGGGRHLVFKYPIRKITNRANVVPGVDVRGDNGYIVASPSNHISGGVYSWKDNTEIADAPTWLLDLIAPIKVETATVTAIATRMPTVATADTVIAFEGGSHRNIQRAMAYANKCNGAASGDRNANAFNLAGHLWAFNIDISDVSSIMSDWNNKNTPPLDNKELADVIKSARDNGTPRAPKPDRIEITATATATGVTGTRKLLLVNYDDVEDEIIEWVWEDRIEKNDVNIIFGDGDTGKSFIALDIAARITKGVPMPNSTTPTDIGDVLYFCREMSDGKIKGRARAVGMDFKHFMGCKGQVENPNSTKTTTLTIDEVNLLIDYVKEYRPRLMVIDPIISILGDVVTDGYKSIYDAIDPLVQIAHEYKVTIIGITHCNKGQGIKAKDKMMGSVAFRNAVRATDFVFLDPTDETGVRRIFAQDKCNDGKRVKALTFELISNGAQYPKVVWGSETDVKADDYANPNGPTLKKDYAEEWIKDYLSDGEKLSDSMWPAAKAAGLKWDTFKKAQSVVAKPFRKGFGKDGAWYVRLKDSMTIEGVGEPLILKSKTDPDDRPF